MSIKNTWLIKLSQELKHHGTTITTTQTFYDKLSDLGRIGIEKPPVKPPVNYVMAALPLKFKPPKFPKKSKHIYKGIFIRSMKPFKALYDVETSIYIVSVMSDPFEWIDTNYEEIRRRVNYVSSL